uniref:coiled-coil domain-containing protein n=1 Tax=Sulfuricurvum sp. TaxID=2025608 RepID=UPI0025F1C154
EAYDRMLHQNTIAFLNVFEQKADFSPVPYLVSIPEEIRTPLLENFLKFYNDLDAARQMIRQQIEQIFDLDSRDIIFFLRGRITIRHYTPPKKFAEGADKRFAGESIEDMEAMYGSYFPNGAWEHIEPILGEVIAEKLNFSVIDNLTFTRTFIPVFRSMIEILLFEIIKPEERNKVEGFSGFVLREYFHKILLYTAKNLLQYIENRDKNAEAFIKYFADEVIIDVNGNKIQKYAITDSKQQKWNFSAVVSVMMQYKQVKLKIIAQKETILIADKEVNECQNEVAVEKNNKEIITEKLADLQETLAENDAAIIRLKNQTGATPEEKVSLKSQINRLNYHQTELLDLKKKTFNQIELSKNKIANKISELTRRQRKLDYEKKALQTYLEQMAAILETYETVSEALATVLTKR